MLIKNSLVSTASQVAGRLPNFLLPLAFLAKFGGSKATDTLFLGFALVFFLGSTLSNAASDAFTSRLTASITCKTDGLWAQLVICLSLLSFFLVIVFSSQIGWYSYFIAFVSVLLVYVGLSSAFLVSKLYFYGDFVTPGTTWGLRWIAVIAILLFDNVISAACAFFFLVLMADFFRMIILRNVVKKYEAPISFGSKETIASGAIIWFMLSASLSGLNPLIDRLITSYLGGGAVSQLELIERLASLFLLLPTIGVMQVINVEVSKKIKSGHSWNLDHFLFLWFLASFAWSVLCVIFIFVLTKADISLIGEQSWIDEEKLLFGLVTLVSMAPSLFVGMICVRILLAINKNKTVLVFSAVSLLVNAVASLILAIGLGVNGVLLATLFTYSLTAMLLISECSKHRSLILNTP